jgi:hypothetical protein
MASGHTSISEAISPPPLIKSTPSKDAHPYRIESPEAMDDADWAVHEATGWLDVTVAWDGGKRVLSFYHQAGRSRAGPPGLRGRA